MSNNKTNSLRSKKAPNRILLLGVFSLAIVGGLLVFQIVRAEGRILPNVYVGGINIGNKNPEQAHEVLSNALRVMNLSGIEFVYQDRSLVVKGNEKSAAPTEQSIITYDLNEMVENAFLYGNKETRRGFVAANIQALFSKINIPISLSVNRDALRSLLKEEFGDLEFDPSDAKINVVAVKRYTPAANETAEQSIARTNFKVVIIPETVGTSFNYDQVMEVALSGLPFLNGGTYQLSLTEEIPNITENKAKLLEKDLFAANKIGGLTFAYDDLTWELNGKDYMNALTLKAYENGSLYVGFDPEELEPLLNRASKKIDQEPVKTTLVLNEARDRAAEFAGGQIGKTLNYQESLRVLEQRLPNAEELCIPLSVDLTPAPDSDQKAEELGIREMIGWGTSDFSGSPQNRRKNIRNGVDRLNGWLIKPGEEFGLLEKLRPFNDYGGYVQELVIKGDRTIKEYGGGLCQIGTTAFRAVMGAGLPITARRNHSFRVRYYEPVGTDATLYDPAPDFKFVNDTQHNVLFVTRMLGDILRFEFWGTRDGRVQERSKVDIISETPPPAPKLIETSALAAGERKCFEHATKGAVTSFDYTITYQDGEKNKSTYRSVYKPWQEQCLVGKVGAPNIKLMWDGSIKEFPPEGQDGEVKDIIIVPDGAQCTVGGCSG